MDRDCRSALALILCLASLLAGCASTGPAPVEDRSLGGPARTGPSRAAAPRAAAAAGFYRIRRGDTLYSIAFRHGLDYRDLAAWNRIDAPYTIYPGRDLRLSPPRGTPRSAPAPGVVRSEPSAPPPVASAPPATARANQPGPFEPVAPASRTAAANPREPAPAEAASAPPAAAPPAAAAAEAGGIRWRWPADGAIVGTYVAGDPVRQGIDIAGDAGAPVRAAADGTVVYSGNGLIGYGELIIVKHSPTFLSAYGHNRKRLVQEGDAVKAGQTIAEMGSSGATRDELHFEIRRNGKPIDPLEYLPHR